MNNKKELNFFKKDIGTVYNKSFLEKGMYKKVIKNKGIIYSNEKDANFLNSVDTVCCEKILSIIELKDIINEVFKNIKEYLGITIIPRSKSKSSDFYKSITVFFDISDNGNNIIIPKDNDFKIPMYLCPATYRRYFTLSDEFKAKMQNYIPLFYKDMVLWGKYISFEWSVDNKPMLGLNLDICKILQKIYEVNYISITDILVGENDIAVKLCIFTHNENNEKILTTGLLGVNIITDKI